MGLKEEIHKVIDVFNLNLDGDLLFDHYNNNTNKFRTQLEEKKAKLLKGPLVQVMSSVASRGGQKGGNMGAIALALLICILGMTLVIYNKIKENDASRADFYEKGLRGRNTIMSRINRLSNDTNRMTSRLNSALENKKKAEENVAPVASNEGEEEVPGLYNLTPQHVQDSYEQRQRDRQNAMPTGTVPGGQRLGGQDIQQSEVYTRSLEAANKRQQIKMEERERKKKRSKSRDAAEKRRAKSKKNGGGRKKKKRTRKKKRRN